MNLRGILRPQARIGRAGETGLVFAGVRDPQGKWPALSLAVLVDGFWPTDCRVRLGAATAQIYMGTRRPKVFEVTEVKEVKEVEEVKDRERIGSN